VDRHWSLVREEKRREEMGRDGKERLEWKTKKYDEVSFTE
jgi:hypothetical protein